MSLQLIGTNKANSTLLTYDGSTQQVNLYSSFGSVDNSQNSLLPGFNGERPDPFTGVSHLGNGYRAYNPILMRFTCPDNESPFGVGGINPYAYCQNDPVNSTDPSGHGVIYRVIKRAIIGLLKHFIDEEVAKSVGKGIAKLSYISITYGTQLTAAATNIAAYEETSDDPEMAMKLEKVGKAIGSINAIVTIINAPLNLVNDFKHLHSRSGSFTPSEAVNESIVMTSTTMKDLRKIERSVPVTKIALKGVTTTMSTDELIVAHGQLELGDIEESTLQRIIHGVKDTFEAVVDDDIKTKEDFLLHDNSIRTRPTVIYGIISNISALGSTGFSIEGTVAEKSDISASEELLKISDYVGTGSDIMDFMANVHQVKKDAMAVKSILHGAVTAIFKKTF